MTASERLRSCWGPSRLVHHAISGHRSEASFRSYIGRPSSEKIITCSDILSDTSSGRPHQSLQPSFTALSSRAILITSRVSPYTSFVLKPLPACFITEQSIVKASLFVNKNSRTVIKFGRKALAPCRGYRRTSYKKNVKDKKWKKTCDCARTS